ncbi:sialidase-3.1 [Trichomycterus rosablanca]|uniref:sialidase-3.1 n=1 Tax=Trichomycterus rosablanca TaxID=2290929 RepID=UPI002F35596F
MRRGTRHNGTIQWSQAQELRTACLKGREKKNRTMNPCPVYETGTQTLFLFFICVLDGATEREQISSGRNKARLCYVTSKDCGQTWSDTTDLTESVIGQDIRNWATFAVGPGHGIQMKSGRLIIPAYVYYIHCRWFHFGRPLKVRSHALAFYSDDCGSTWHVGEKVITESCECEMAEIIDQERTSYLYCNARSTKGQRVEALSATSGEAFDRDHLEKKLVEPDHGCQGSVLSFTAPEQTENRSGSETKSWLLYSHPTNKKKRKDLGVYLNRSPLRGVGWNEPWIIYHGPSGYSDLTQCEETQQRFACLMECGKKSEVEEIAFVEFSLNDVLNN